MKVSIIIPVYNVQEYILECLNSVASQNYEHLECILVDDCSTDSSQQLILDFIHHYKGNKNFKFISLPSNSGASAARNRGIDQATGDYVFFLDSDDILPDGSISSLMQVNDKYGYPDLVHGEIICENQALFNEFSLTKKNIPQFCNTTSEVKKIIFTEFPISPCNKLIKRSILKDNNLFFKEGITNEDVLWIFALRLKIASFALDMTPTYFYRYNSSSVMTSSSNEKNRIRSYTYVLKELINGINPTISFWDNFAIIKHFEHNKLITIHDLDNEKLFEIEFNKCIRLALRSKNVQLRFKPLYYWLQLNNSIFKKTNFLFKKYLGILYRIEGKA